MINNLKNSKVFNEFVCERVEEIIMGDEKSQSMNKDVLLYEEKLKEILTPDQLPLFREFVNKLCDHTAHNETLLYKQGLKDKVFFT